MMIIFFILVSVGFYMILADIFNVANIKASKVILDANRRNKKKSTKTIETIILDYAILLSKYIKIDEYKKSKLESTLKSADIRISPETYLSQVYIKVGIALVLGLVFYMVLPILGILIMLFSINVYMVEYKRAERLIGKKKEKIEIELPKFASTIEQELKYNHDVFGILERYQKNSKSCLGEELEITIADMTSGSYEEALRRFETRIGSNSLSEIVRGLIGVLNGSNETIYFSMLANQLKSIEYQRLRREALKRPAKIKVYSAMMMGCLVMIYFTVLGYEMMKGISQMF